MGKLKVGFRGAVATVVFLFLAVAAEAAEPSYTAVVDAGSGGTRLYLCKVMPGPYPTSELLLSKQSDDAPDTPYEEDDGIDNYA